MLYELAIADAYGASFEFTDSKFISKNNKMRYLRHPKRDHENIMSGQYTDDTQMSLAVAELMLESDMIITQEDFAARFVHAFQRDPRKGYSGRMYDALKAVGKIDLLTGFTSRNASFEFLQYLGNSSSTANGCVMRTLPIGLLPKREMIERFCILHASVTHTSLEAIEATIVTSMACHALYYNLCGSDGLVSWLACNNNPFNDYYSRFDAFNFCQSRVGCNAVETMIAAIWLVHKYKSLSLILRNAIQLGGDTDSVAAVAVGLASLAPDIKQDLPLSLKRGLENSTYGKGYLRELDKRLLKKFPRKLPDNKVIAVKVNSAS